MRFLKSVILADTGRPAEAQAILQQLVAGLSRARRAAQQPRRASMPPPATTASRAPSSRRRSASIPSYAPAHENLGDVHALLAAQSYARALRLEPASASLPRKLALVRQLTAPSSEPRRRAAAAGRPRATLRRCPSSIQPIGVLDAVFVSRFLTAAVAAVALCRRRRRAGPEGQARHLGRRHRRRARRGQGAEDGRQLPPVRQGRALRRHDLPSRHRQLHDPGRRHDRRHEGEADARADRRSRAATA